MVSKRTRILLAASLALLILGSACSSDDEGAVNGGTGEIFEQLEATEAQRADELGLAPALGYDKKSVSLSDADQPGAGGGGQSAVSHSSLPSLGPSVIKTASLGVEVVRDGLQDAVRDATTTAGRHGGYVVSSTLDREGRSNASLVIRIPSDRFERALAEIEDLGEVTSKGVEGQDVGQEFIDLDARLRNWRAQQAVLLGLMDRATTIAETIRVHNELSSVELQIEQIRGRLRFLTDRTAFGTITAVFEIEGAPVPGKTSRLGRAWEEALDAALGVVSGVIVAAGVVLPIAILAALALLILRQLRPRFERPPA